MAPGSLEVVEGVLGLLGRVGFRTEAVHAFQAGVSFVVGHTLWRFGSADPAEQNEFGLDALVLGLEAKLRRKKR
jgi:hypothetical protein